MKALNYFSIIIFILALFISPQKSQAQAWNPLRNGNLDLSKDQREQLRAIDENYQKQTREIYESIVSPEDKASLNKLEELKAQREEARKKVLTPQQLEQFQGWVVEQEMDVRGRRIEQMTERMEQNYPGLNMTSEQYLQFYEKEKEAKKEKGYWKKRKEIQKDILKEILDEQQFKRYVRIEKESKIRKEEELLVEVQKGYAVAEEIFPMIEDFALPKYKVLRNKLESKISKEDKATLAELRRLRTENFAAGFQNFQDEKEEEVKDIENSELVRYIDFTTELVEGNMELLSNIWEVDYQDEIDGELAREVLETLLKKYDSDINALNEELLFVTKEMLKKGAVIVSNEYPIPPVVTWINEVTFPREAKVMFLLLDPTIDFSIDLPDFEKGEGEHFANVFPNPAQKNQVLEFFTQQDGKVKIEILDAAGRVVKMVADKNLIQGKQKIEVNLQDLNAQVYFYRITGKNGTTMLKFVKE